MWPATMVQRLAPLVPDDFTAEPRVHLGSYFEIDVCAYEHDEPKRGADPCGRIPEAWQRRPRCRHNPRSRSMPIWTSSTNMKFLSTIKAAAASW